MALYTPRKAGVVYLRGKKLASIYKGRECIYRAGADALGEMVLVIRIIDRNIGENGYTIDLSPFLAVGHLPLTLSYKQLIVDWGDGTNRKTYTLSDQRGETLVTHSYSEEGEYRITLKGLFKWGLGSNIYTHSLRDTLIRIELPSGKSSIVDVDTYAFAYCRVLASIPQGLLDNCTYTRDFSYCFYTCSDLPSVPQDLFDKCVAANKFDYCYAYCVKLEGALPTLWVSHPSASHTNWLYASAGTSAPNYAAAKAAGWG